MESKTGDMFATTAGALGHGVNVDGAMGAGIALTFRRKFPGLYLDYRQACRDGSLHPGGLFPFLAGDGRWIYNMASQDRPGPHARIEWIESAARLALNHAAQHGLPVIAIPQIGSRIGGLNWVEVERALERAEDGCAAHFEVWTLPQK